MKPEFAASGHAVAEGRAARVRAPTAPSAKELTREDQVAAAVAPDFLRHPAVVARVAKADKIKVVEGQEWTCLVRETDLMVAGAESEPWPRQLIRVCCGFG
ncbi:DUF6192 family protein [Streptomyces filipinensis]|uniref:DUF6192 family protein n=1 Tax=Streptomyces filipinensis TaxID=66887 RepID=UPI0036EB9C2C